MNQPQLRIGITDSLQSKEIFDCYIHWIRQVDPTVEMVALSHTLNNGSLLDEVDALLLTGGGDVHPRFYGKEGRIAETDGVNEKRDLFEFDLIEKALDNNLPIVGICRGMQVMNVALGGSLVVDLPTGGFEHYERNGEEARWHDLKVIPGSLLGTVCHAEQIYVNSFHHQAVEKLGNGLMASAVSPDNVVEAAEWIMKDRMPFLMLVQWHPERMKDTDPASKNIVERFVREIKQSIITKNETTTHNVK